MLAAILIFIGVKMLIVRWHPISTPLSLAVVLGILAVSIGVSVGIAPDEHGQGTCHAEEVPGFQRYLYLSPGSTYPPH